MKILTWNINGIRAVKEPLNELFIRLEADIICLQETKVTRDQLDEPSAIVEGFNSYFSFSKVKSGYSGVATFVRNTYTPIKAAVGLTGLLDDDNADDVGCYGNQSDFSDEELLALDNEGRTVITQHQVMDSQGEIEKLTIINVYCPRADPEKEERKAFKLSFYKMLQIRAEALLSSGSHVIILGDVNTSHQKIDHCDPSDDKEFLANPGRVWLSQFLADSETLTADSPPPPPPEDSSPGGNFMDSFRYFHPDQTNAFTCWSTVTGARATNYGTRIDYIFGNMALVKKAFSACIIMPEVEGSDHCPVKATLEWEVIGAAKCPSTCTKYHPEFTGRQQKLSAFFTKTTGREVSKSKPEIEVVSIDEGDRGELSSSQGSAPDICTKLKSVKCKEGVGLKRARSNPTTHSSPSKKLKQEDKKLSKSKQGSLLNFFSQPSHKSKIDSPPAAEPPQKSPEKRIHEPLTQPSESHSDSTPGKDTTKQSSASWKALLKGPPPPPMCKGHQEPCLLRTVKKDSLNKGRQFWVCPRPEGHKNNPEARCDYFVWIDKRKA